MNNFPSLSLLKIPSFINSKHLCKIATCRFWMKISFKRGLHVHSSACRLDDPGCDFTPRCFAGGKSRSPSTTLGITAERETPQISPIRSTVLGLVIPSVERLEVCSPDRLTGHGRSLAPNGILVVLEMEIETWKCWPAQDREGHSGSDSADIPGEPALGCTAHSGGTSSAGSSCRGIHGGQVHGQGSKAAFSDAENIPGESHETNRRY